MKRFAKILMASLLAFALTAASVPALVAYARDETIDGRGVIGVDDTIPPSSSTTTSSSSLPTTTSAGSTTTSRPTTTTTSSDGATTTSNREPDIVPPSTSMGGGTGGGGGGAGSVPSTSDTSVRVTTTSRTIGLGTGETGGTSAAGADPASVTSRSETSSSQSNAPGEEIELADVPADAPLPNATMDIFGYDIALGGPRQVGGWSLFSLLMVVLSVLTGLFFAIRNKTKGSGDKVIYMVSALAVFPVLLFFMLQDFSEMYLFNHLSALFGVLFVVHLIALLAVSLKNRKQGVPEED